MDDKLVRLQIARTGTFGADGRTIVLQDLQDVIVYNPPKVTKKSGVLTILFGAFDNFAVANACKYL